MRHQFCEQALADMFAFLGGQDPKTPRVGILDATNSTLARRNLIRERVGAAGFDLFWVESVCDDEARIEQNIREVKVRLAEYGNIPLEEAMADFKTRIEFYRADHTPLEGALVRERGSGRGVRGQRGEI